MTNEERLKNDFDEALGYYEVNVSKDDLDLMVRIMLDESDYWSWGSLNDLAGTVASEDDQWIYAFSQWDLIPEFTDYPELVKNWLVDHEALLDGYLSYAGWDEDQDVESFIEDADVDDIIDYVLNYDDAERDLIVYIIKNK